MKMDCFFLPVCPIGWYGEHCSQRCGTNCKDCNKSSGICEFGCYDGWKGRVCENSKDLFNEI